MEFGFGLLILILFVVCFTLWDIILLKQVKIIRKLEGKYLITKLELLDERNANIEGDNAYQELKNKYNYLLKKYRFLRRKQLNHLFRKGGGKNEKNINSC